MHPPRQVIFAILNKCLTKPSLRNVFYQTLSKMIISSPVSQFFPIYPSSQSHVYPLMPSMQLPPFLQGLLAQSLMSTELNDIVNKFDNEM